MEWIKKHVDTVIVLGGILSAVLWMNGKFNAIDLKFAAIELKFAAIELKFASIESDIRNINTVLICRGMMPKELAAETTISK